MYIKKSVLSGIILWVGGVILCITAILFCFTELSIPRYVYITVCLACIWSVMKLTERVDRGC